MSCCAIANSAELEQRAQVLCGSVSVCSLLGADADARIVGRGKRLQVEARAPGAHRHLAAGASMFSVASSGSARSRSCSLRAATVIAWLPCRQIAVRGDLHLEVGGRHVEAAVLLLEQDVGENRQRVPAFDDAGDGLQRFQQRVAGDLF